MDTLRLFFELLKYILGLNSSSSITTNGQSVNQSAETSSEASTTTQNQNYSPMDGNKIALVGDSWASGMKRFWKLGAVYAYPGKMWPQIAAGCAKAAAAGYKNIVVWCGVNGYTQKASWHSDGVVKCCKNAPNSNIWFFQYAKQKRVRTKTRSADPNMEKLIRSNVLPGIRDGVSKCKNARFTDLSDREYPLNISKETPVNGVYKHDGFHLTDAGFKQLANDIMSIVKGNR